MPLLHFPTAAGADEAGRGPLAGPVVAAAVVLPAGFDLEGIDDSKKLDRSKRETLAQRIREEAAWAVVSCAVEEVDRLNVLWASMEAMRRALHELDRPFEHVYIDGNHLPPGLPWTAEAVIDGDATHACIAAASILAKVERDQLMVELAEVYPEYGFDKHFGYATPVHLQALREHGPCPIHRRSFGRIREMIEQPCLIFDA
jgi:ribonuclease HII